MLTEKLAEFERHLRDREKSAATVEKYLRDASAFCAFLGDGELKRERVIEYKEKELTKAEYLRLVETAKIKANERLALLIQTICGTGIRVSELRFITVEAAKRGEAVVSCKGKTRTVFLVKELRKKLLRYCAEQGIRSGCIFITKSGNPMNRTSVWREMKNLCRKARVAESKVFPHNLRHLFARTFYGIEKDIAKLADILGHSSIDTTRIYIISTGTELRRRMEHMRLVI